MPCAPMPTYVEVGAVMQHRSQGDYGAGEAPPPLVVVGWDKRLQRWLCVDRDWRLACIYPGVTDRMYTRVQPNRFRGKNGIDTYRASGSARWRRTLGAGRVSVRT